MRKQFAKFVEFSVDEMHHISQHLKEWLGNSGKQVRLWTVNAIACTTSHCSLRILGWRSDWAVLFRKWGRKCSNIEWRTVLQQDNEVFGGLSWTIWIWKTCGSSRTAQPVALRAKQLSCEKIFVAVSSHTMMIRIGHQGRAIWHHATSFFGGLWNLVSMPTNHKQFLISRWRFNVSLAKLSRSYAEMSSRVSSKDQECASRVVEAMCWILCSTVNHSECTLYWNKTISTFWINGSRSTDTWAKCFWGWVGYR